MNVSICLVENNLKYILICNVVCRGCASRLELKKDKSSGERNDWKLVFSSQAFSLKLLSIRVSPNPKTNQRYCTHILTCKSFSKKRINLDSTLMSPHGQFTCCLCHKSEKPDLTTTSRSPAIMTVKMGTEWTIFVKIISGNSLLIHFEKH